jgi:predicted DNA-binding transcriptional regulator AlpA
VSEQKLISLSELVKMIGVSTSTILCWVRDGSGNFPAPRRSTPGKLVWREADIEAWMEMKKGES